MRRLSILSRRNNVSPLFRSWRRMYTELTRNREEEGPKLAPIEPMVRIMHPDWYRTPHPEDDPRMIGDYPDVPATSYQLRDPYARYFDQQNRRNWGEPMPEDYEPLSMWSFDHETSFGKWWIIGSFGGFFGGMFCLYHLLALIPSPFKELIVTHSYLTLISLATDRALRSWKILWERRASQEMERHQQRLI